MKNALRQKQIVWVEAPDQTDKNPEFISKYTMLGYLEGDYRKKEPWSNMFCALKKNGILTELFFYDELTGDPAVIQRKHMTFFEAKAIANKRLAKVHAAVLKHYYI